MKRMIINQAVMTVVIGAALAAAPKLQAAATLKVGDAAPKLQVAKWAQGEPVKGFENGKAYIVEFWATWCGPCRVSIPHLNELHEKYKDKGLIVIGQDCWEQDEEKVEPFIKKMGEKMTYRVALDDKSKEEKGAMAKTWMEAADQNGIPSAFVINKSGKIVWIGHPMELKEKMLEDVLADKFDVEKAKKEAADAQKNQEALMAASQKFGKLMNAKKWDEADAAANELEKLLTEEQRPMLGMARFQILVGKKDYTGAYKTASTLSDAQPDNAMLQNQIAWIIVTQKDLEKRDLTVAEKAADRAVKASKGKDAGILDTLARVQFMNGKKKEAIATQEKAIEIAETDMKDSLKETLTSYKADKLPSAED